MNINNRDKQLIWRALCTSELEESKRLWNLRKGPYSKANESMIEKGEKRVKDIRNLKSRLWEEMK